MMSTMFYFSVYERRLEIITFKALGFTKLDIYIMFILEAYILSLISSFISFITTYLFSLTTNLLVDSGYIIKFEDKFSFISMDYKLLVLLILISIFVTLISTIIPLKKVSKLQIIDVLRNK